MVDPVPALTLFGVPIHDVSLPETLEWVARWIAGQRPRQIATVNPEFLMAARRDPTFRAVLQGAGLCVPDGVGVTLAARYLGRPLRERVAGVDLVERLAAHAADAGWRLFLLGGAPGIAERAGAVLTGRHPTLTICGTYAGSPAVEDEEEILQRVRTARADVLLVAYGAPAQDLWLARNLARSGAKVGIGIGGGAGLPGRGGAACAALGPSPGGSSGSTVSSASRGAGGASGCCRSSPCWCSCAAVDAQPATGRVKTKRLPTPPGPSSTQMRPP
jgi:N-acetylglucosaminyldiphosphoundecaprenol N-acetyl-beta-D-mannosaminyltransferase